MHTDNSSKQSVDPSNRMENVAGRTQNFPAQNFMDDVRMERDAIHSR